MEIWILILCHSAIRCAAHLWKDLLGGLLCYVLQFIGKLFTYFSVPLPLARSNCDMCSLQESRETEKTEQQETTLVQMPPMEESHIKAIEEILGYKFLNSGLVAEAMTHHSLYFPSKGDKSYERLEFLGDAVLNSGVATYVFCKYPDLQPGTMTRLRSANVDKEKLARIAVTLGLHRYLRHKVLNLESQIHDFVEDMKDYPVHSNGLMATPKVLSDIVESLIGAVFIDTNMSHETAWKVFIRLSKSFITVEILGKHPISELQELSQNLKHQLKFSYKNWPYNNTIEVLLDGRVLGSNCMSYNSKKDICQNRAAKAALVRLKELLSNNHLDRFLNSNN